MKIGLQSYRIGIIKPTVKMERLRIEKKKKRKKGKRYPFPKGGLSKTA